MKFNLILIFFLIVSCSSNYTKLDNRKPYNSKGFAYIYNQEDFKNKIIKLNMDNEKLQIAHNSLSKGSLIKLINPKTKEYLVLTNISKTEFPDFYKILITKKVADKLNININIPLIEVLEIKKNKSFVAKKAKIYNEEKKLSSKAPVTSVKISNISKIVKNKKNVQNKFYILIATFYNSNSASFLKKRIIEDNSNFDVKKLIIKKRNNNKTDLISGPYSSINSLKNDYINLKNFGFEELDVSINE